MTRDSASSRRLRQAHALPFLAIIWLCSCGVTSAHEARPLLVDIVEHEGPVYRVNVRVPPSVPAFNQPQLQWPASCAVRSRGTGMPTAESADHRILLSCAGPLEGERITIRYPVLNPTVSTLIRYTPHDGQTISTILPPDEPAWLIPRTSSWGSVARDYTELGVEHIWGGLDHLLFVAGLLLLAGSWRQMLVAVTCFTIAHSITLASSVLGLVRIAAAPAEAAIALSILFVAREIVCADRARSGMRHILVVSFFGLLHGFGFATALSEAGLPREDVTAALLFFNIGVEIGQLIFVLCCIGLMVVTRKIAQAVRNGSWQRTTPVAKRLGGYGIGVFASLWLIQRIEAFFV